jgi:hypothetical protein
MIARRSEKWMIMSYMIMGDAEWQEERINNRDNAGRGE